MSEPLKFLNTDFIRVIGKNMANTPIAITRPELGSVLEVTGKFQFLRIFNFCSDKSQHEKF